MPALMPSERGDPLAAERQCWAGSPSDWPAGVVALTSTRRGGASGGPYASYNLGLHVGDDTAKVMAHRKAFEQALGGQAAWLRQVHGHTVADAQAVMAARAQGLDTDADASISTEPGVAAVVLVADCLPVLLARVDGQAVAAAHAGWRGLASGVLENTVRALRTVRVDGRQLPDSPVVAWLGPCIGPRAFEVGDDVREAFGEPGAAHFLAHRRRDGSPAWLCDLAGLARQRLAVAGVRQSGGGDWCTVENPSAFFSFRRDGVTGRMAAGICRSR